MNEKYLWDKTGEDAEIEELENALRAFRYRETPPPVVRPMAATAPAAPAAARKPGAALREFFGLRPLFAFASTAALVMAAFAMLYQFSRSEPHGGRDLAARPVSFETTAPENLPLTPPAPHERPAENEIEETRPPARPPIVRNRPRAAAASARRPKTTPPAEMKAQKLILSKEEQDAYDQLMLALSITSSKLKIVKDKALGLENDASTRGK